MGKRDIDPDRALLLLRVNPFPPDGAVFSERHEYRRVTNWAAEEITRLRAENERLNGAVSTAIGRMAKADRRAGFLEGLLKGLLAYKLAHRDELTATMERVEAALEEKPDAAQERERIAAETEEKPDD